MNASRMSAAIAGLLFLIAMVASLLGGGLIEATLAAPDRLAAIAEHKTRVLVGVLLEVLNAIAVIGIATLLYPILRQHNEQVARAYLGLRIVEAVFCCVIVMSPLSLIALAQTSGAAPEAAVQAAAALSLAERASVASLLIPVFFSLGALLFYALLYREQLIPRFLSLWGLIGAALILVNTLLGLGVEVEPGLTLALVLPIIVNEIVLGIWLIVRGFGAPAGAAAAAQPI